MLLACVSTACAEQTDEHLPSRWTRFVQVAGQPEPVPAEWVATPAGQLAHSIQIPNPLPKSSGYRKGMKSNEYFDHLCGTEAGEFIYKTVNDVEGFYFMRPPNWPTDHDLKDRYKLEAPETERLFQLMRSTPTERAKRFVNPPWRLYRFVEEPSTQKNREPSYVRSYGYRQNSSEMENVEAKELRSKFGLIWRGLKRPMDRELSIAGGEWIVFALETKEVLAVMRMYGLSPKAKTPQRIWWLNASQCSSAAGVRTAASNSKQLYRFVSKVLHPPEDVKQ